MADEWLAGIGGGLDALAQVLQRRKLEKLQAAAVAEKIRQFNVQEARHEREAQAREAESTRYHDLLQQQRQDVLSTAAGVRRDQMAQDLLTKAPIAPGQDIGEGPAGNLRTRGYGSLLRTTLPPVGSRGEPAPMAPGVLTAPGGAVPALPGGLRPTTRQPAQVDFPEGNPPYQEARAKEAARLAEIEAKAADARTTKEAAERPRPTFRTNRQTGAPEQTGEVPFNAIVREEPPAAARAPVRVRGTDENGNPTEMFVTPEQAMAGGPWRTPLNAPTMSRAFLAKTALQTGYDIIKETQDPTVRAQLGVMAGRYNSLREFIGNPPKEFPKVLGTIMSFAKANQGIHGQRSEEGAQHMERFLNTRLEPEALANAVRGINNFGRHFLENVGMKAPEEPEPLATPSPARAPLRILSIEEVK